MDFMLDLETFGITSSAPVFAVGCVPVLQPDDEGFYSLVCPEGSPDFGTIAYWLKQAGYNPEAASQAIAAIEGGADYTTTLLDLRDYMTRKWAMAYDGQGIDPSDRDPIRVWSKGSIFDIAILRQAYEHRSLDVPWHFREEMCFRTIEAVSGKDVPDPETTVKHHAREDARWQARKLKAILEANASNPTLAI